MNPIALLDYAGVAVFAATGALAASRKQLDIIGFLFLASVTGIGGGTFRDLILNVPVFWVGNRDYVLICAVVAVLVFFTAHRVESRYKLLLWLDAIGLAAFSVMGAAKGLAITGSPVVSIITGMLTATFGGILRDLLAGEPSVLLRPEIYVTAALAGAAIFTLGDVAGLPQIVSGMAGFVVALAVRGGALRFGWSFPSYRSRPGRRPEDIP
ncbi:trimeric intracellular cation channel family protein [Mesorhizobium sp. 2RAF45]|uniref:trimeric intracellular cation channel family protein n=1 Tax=Mesorhizobium sp. 2RAF45 TaxID=3233001 RepID=UPI003F9B64E6